MAPNTRKLALVIIAETFLVFVLHRSASLFPIPWNDLSAWIRFTDLDQTVPALLRLGTLGLSYWLLVSSLAYTSAAAANVPRALRLLSPLTLPSIQRLSQRAVSVSLAASMFAPTLPMAASAQTTPPPDVVITQDGVLLPPGIAIPGDVVDEQPVYTPTPAPRPGGRDTDAVSDRLTAYAQRHASAPQPTVSSSQHVITNVASTAGQSSSTHTVRRGENLWTIAEAHLAGVKGSSVSDAEIAPYWGRVIADNQDSLASHNPDIINPGEVIILPPVEVP